MRAFDSSLGRLARSFVVRATLLAAVWWVLTESKTGDYGIAALAVLVATASSFLTIPPGGAGVRPWGLARFLPYFLRQSVRGGIDIAWRALHPRLPVKPGFIEHHLRLRDGPARIFFVNAVSLLPGTISTELHGRVLRVHVLDQRMPVGQRLAELEERVSGIFGGGSQRLAGKTIDE